MGRKQRTSTKEVKTRYQRGADFEREVRVYLAGSDTRKRPVTGLLTELRDKLNIAPQAMPTTYTVRSAGSRGVFDVLLVLTYEGRRHYLLGVQCKKGRLSLKDRERIAASAYASTHIPAFFIWKQSRVIHSIPDITQAITNILLGEVSQMPHDGVGTVPPPSGNVVTDSELWFAGLVSLLVDRRTMTHKVVDACLADVRLTYWHRLLTLLDEQGEVLHRLGFLNRATDEVVAMKRTQETYMHDYVRPDVIHTAHTILIPSAGYKLIYGTDRPLSTDGETAQLLYTLTTQGSGAVRLVIPGGIITHTPQRVGGLTHSAVREA